MGTVQDELQELRDKVENMALREHMPTLKLEKFGGKFDRRDFHEFLREFYKVGNMYNWSDKKCCQVLPAFLTGDAEAAYESLGDGVKKNWTQLCDALAIKVSRVDDLAFQRRQLFEIRQGVKESPNEFGFKMIEAVKRAYPDKSGYTEVQRESIAIDHFINGIKNELQDELIRQQPKTMVKAIEVARAEEAILNRKKNNNAQSEIKQLRSEVQNLNEKIVEINAIANQSPQNRLWVDRSQNGGRGQQNSSGKGWKPRWWQNRGQSNNFRQNGQQWNINGPGQQQGHNSGQNQPQWQNGQNQQNFGQNQPQWQNNSQNQQNFGQNQTQWQNNWQGQNNSYRGRGRGRGQARGQPRGQARGRGRGGYSINDISANCLPLLSIIILCCLVNYSGGKEYKICPQPRSGYLLAWPTLQDCEKPISKREEVTKGEIEIFVQKTAPTFLPGFKCAKITTQFCTKRILRFIDIDEWQNKINELISEEECWTMVKNASNSVGQVLVQKNADLWETHEELISPQYAIFGTKCVNATTWKLQVGTVGSFDGKGMVSELEEMSKCSPEKGMCTFDDNIIIWPKPNETTYCTFESAGKYEAMITKEYILVEDIQAAFVEAEGQIPPESRKCVPANAKLMENEVIISIIDEHQREKRGINQISTASTSLPLPPLANTTWLGKRIHTSASLTSAMQTTSTMSSTTTKVASTTTKGTNKFTQITSVQTQNTQTQSTKRKGQILTGSTQTIWPESTVPVTQRAKTPFDVARGEEAFFEHFRVNRLVTTTIKATTLKTTKVHEKYNEFTRPPPIALAQNAQTGQYKQENNNLNVKMQYNAVTSQKENKENFNKIWKNVCRLHNYQISIIRSILRINPTEGIRLWLNRSDLTAIHNGEALLVAPCTIVKPHKVIWSHTIGANCFEYTPVQLENMTLFIIPGTDELALHSPNISCANKPVPAYLNKEGEWRTEYGMAQVSSANQHLVLQTKQKLIKFRASSIFNSDLHRIAAPLASLSAYTKRINKKLAEIPKMTHIESTSDLTGETFVNLMGELIDKGKSLVNETLTDNPFSKIKSLFDSWQKIVRNIAITCLVIAAVIGIIYTYPWWSPVIKKCRPKKKQEVTVAAIQREETEFRLLGYYPSVYTIGGKYNKGKKAHIEIRINGNIVVAMVDPGAEITYCRESVAKHLNFKIYKKDIPFATVANQTRLPFIGSATVKIKIENKEIIHPMLVASDQLCPAPVLLGTDIMDDVRCNFKDQYVILDGITMPMIANINISHEHKIYLPEEIHLAPRTDNLIIAETKSRFPTDECLMVLPGKHDYNWLLIGKTLVKPGSSQKVAIRLMNVGNKTLKIYKNSNIAKLEAINGNFSPKTVFHIEGAEYVDEQYKRQNTKENWEEFFPDLAYLDPKEKEALNKVDLTNCVLDERGQKKLIKIIKENRDAFVLKGEIGKYNGAVEHAIHLKPDSAPTSQRPYRVPMHLKEEVEKQITELLSKNIIRPSTSAFCAPIVLVKKKDNSYRMAIDYRQLNKNTAKETYIMPLIQDILDVCGGKKMYTCFDFKMGFYQIKMRPEDVEKTAFGTFLGLFEFLRMPFGLMGAPGTFMRAMNEMRRELTSATFVYMDDVVLASNSDIDHLSDIAQFLNVVIKNGMKLHLGKCKWAMREIKYLGMLISENGIRPDPKNIEAVKNFDRPKTLTQLRSFIGAVSYFRKFIKNFAEIMKPLYTLTKIEKIDWKIEHDEAFTKIIERLTDAPVLKTPRWGKPFILETDASAIALGACLLQADMNGQIHPISYWSRILNKHEKNYHSTELEALAVVEGLKNFEAYIEGSGQTLVRTDNSAICPLLTKKEAKGRLAKFQMIIQSFDVKFEHRSGRTNKFCDYLSRFPAKNENGNKSVQICEIHIEALDRGAIRIQTLKDPVLSKVLKCIRKELPLNNEITKQFTNIELIEENGIIETVDGRIVVPDALRNEILKVLHRAHFGSTKTKARARKLVYWPGIDKEIEKMVAECEACQVISDNPPKVPLQSWEPADRPWQRVHLDFAGPFLGISFIVVVDAFSKFPFIKIMKNTTSESTIEILEDTFSMFGYPAVIVSDNGPQLTSEIFENYLIRNGIIHKKIAPYTPKSNGLAERFVKTSKNAIQKMLGEKNPTKKRVK